MHERYNFAVSLEIVTIPAKVLRKTARRIERNDGIDLQQLYDEMFETLKDAQGVGLAAPQVDKSIRFLLAQDMRTGEVYGVANPQIIEASVETKVQPEGCLSIPGQMGDVERCQWIKLRYQDLDLEEIEIIAEGHFARVLQHEIDHLNGVLISDRAIGGMYAEPEPEEGEGEYEEADEETAEVENK